MFLMRKNINFSQKKFAHKKISSQLCSDKNIVTMIATMAYNNWWWRSRM
jgi:hypothetical protein